MIKTIQRWWDENPYLLIIISAFLIRLFAAIFSKGYGMLDDHFGPIQQPYDIIRDPNIWLNRLADGKQPHGHSIFYPLLHYIYFLFCKTIGLNDPQLKMFIVRFFHVIWSTIAVHFVYKITELISNKKLAKYSAIIFALHWVIPFLSVRNLIEVVAITPMLGAIFYSIKSDNKLDYLVAGLLFGLSFIFRYQTALIATGVCLSLLLNKDILKVGIIFIGFLISVTLIQGSVDIFAWGYPFAAIESYFLYNGNMDNANQYTVGSWYQYFLLLIGLFIPPFSLGIFAGAFSKIKKHLLVFLPMVLFLLFHSWYPNKQERFISTIIPLFIISGVIGWDYLQSKYNFNKKLIRFSVIFYWVINSLLLIIFSTTYGKKARAESLYRVGLNNEIKGVIVDTGIHNMVSQPTFYLNKDVPVLIQLRKDKYPNSDLSDTLTKINSIPNYFIFYGTDDINKRIMNIEELTNSQLLFKDKIEPSLIDNILFKLNPKNNKNQPALIYKSN